MQQVDQEGLKMDDVSFSAQKCNRYGAPYSNLRCGSIDQSVAFIQESMLKFLLWCYNLRGKISDSFSIRR